MAKIVGAILLTALVIAAIRLAIIALILAGLIFKTRTTIGVLLMLAVLSLLATYPVVGVGLIAAAAITALMRAVRQHRGASPNQRLLMHRN